MTLPLRLLLAAAVLSVAPATYSATVPGLDVAVTQNGKPVYRGKTDDSGSFSTGALQPGAYNVEFRAPKSLSLRGQQLAISVSTGKGAPRTSNADGKHMQGGVAMSVEVPKTAKLSGKVSAAAGVAADDSAPAPKGYEKVKANVKVINGKRHVWVPAPIGSNMGGKWVEEGTDEARLSTSNKKGEDREVMMRIQEQASNVGQR
jgi:hypothetical protein